jgi:hypothetical protein
MGPLENASLSPHTTVVIVKEYNLKPSKINCWDKLLQLLEIVNYILWPQNVSIAPIKTTAHETKLNANHSPVPFSVVHGLLRKRAASAQSHFETRLSNLNGNLRQLIWSYAKC